MPLSFQYNGEGSLFFWLAKRRVESSNKKLVIWLNGGPGTTSMVGFFNEHGPYYMKGDQVVSRRNVTWVKSHSIIYIDSPVGAGFSFTDSEMGYTDTTESVTDNLYEAVKQFFQIFPEYQPRDFYVAGQSYAGKLPSMTMTPYKNIGSF